LGEGLQDVNLIKSAKLGTITPMVRKTLYLVVSIFLSISGIQLAAQNDDNSSFSVSVNLIKVPISVFDQAGNLVRNLNAKDFKLWEDKEAQDLRSFGVDTSPVSVVILLDTSWSTIEEQKKIKQAARHFVDALSPGDQFSIITFDDEVKLLLDWTSDKKKLPKAFKNIEPGITTALYDAMFLAASEQLKGIEGRKAIILLTDCVNHDSEVGFKEAAKAIVQSQASFYVISESVIVREQAKMEFKVRYLSEVYKKLIGEDVNHVDEFFEKKEKEMTDLAESSGGRCFFPSDYDQLQGVYAEVAHDMKSKYYLTYVSNQNLLPNSYHRIAIECLEPVGKMIYRQGYWHLPATNPLFHRVLADFVRGRQ
jgi:Ca-activated chloride channel homolog